MWHPVTLFRNRAHRVSVSLNTTKCILINRMTWFGLDYAILRFTNVILVNLILFSCLDWYQLHILNVRLACIMRCIGKGRRLYRSFMQSCSFTNKVWMLQEEATEWVCWCEQSVCWKWCGKTYCCCFCWILAKKRPCFTGWGLLQVHPLKKGK